MINFREFEFWKRSRQLAIDVYEVTKDFPKNEQYGLTSQIRRCAVSIPSTIAEGASRSTKKDFARFLEISIGSAHELETQVDISYSVSYLAQEPFDKISKEINEIIRMTSKYRSRIINS
ncbi:MAG: four helix bundle protein [Crocinitomicaceae bacterium]|jgi:four helix bundle protein